MKSFKTRIYTQQILMLTAASTLLILSSNALAYGNKSVEPKQAVYFIEPKDNATVGQEFKVVMGVKGMRIKPAGDMTENTGHHLY